MSIHDKFSLKDRVVVITGASSGIGRAAAIACAEAGAVVAAVSRNQTALGDLLGQMNAISAKPHFIRSFDVTNFEQIPGLIDDIVTQCGKIGGFVHCAGVPGTICDIKFLDSEVWPEVFKVNTFAFFEFVRAITRRKNITDKKQASLIAISSTASIRGVQGASCYAASKGALNSGVSALGVELARKNIRINAILPGLIHDTPMGIYSADIAPGLSEKHRLGVGETDDLTGPIVFLLSDAASWITGTAMVVDGGMSI